MNELNESKLGRLENNDPYVEGLSISKSNWIKRAGRAIGDSTSLRLLDISIISGEKEGAWLGELLQHLPRNRSIEFFRVYLEPAFVGGQVRRYIYELEWDIFHILTPFIEHNSNLRHIELLYGTSSMLSSLALALSNCKNKRLERISLQEVLAEDDYNQEIRVGNSRIGKLGCMELSKLLRNPASKINYLELGNNELNDECMGILSIGLMRSKNLRKVFFQRNLEVTSIGWGALSAILFHPSCTIEKLWFTEANLDDEGVTYLGEALAVNKSVQYLGLNNNSSITNDGWREFLKCMRNPDSSLEELDLHSCRIDDDGVAMIMNALEENVSIKRLWLQTNHITSRGLITIFNSLLNCEISIESMILRDNSINFEELTEEDWRVLSRALCDKSSISSICSSNHKLFVLVLDNFKNTKNWLDEVWSGIKSLLSMNKNPNKAEVARQKFLEYRLSDEHAGMSVFAGMPDTVLPNALEWVGRSRDIRTFSIMFNVVQGFPTLFEKKQKLSAYPLQHDK